MNRFGKKNIHKGALALPEYSPDKLVEALMTRLGARTGEELAEKINLSGAELSRLRNRKIALTCTQIVRILDACPDMTLADIRRIANVPASVQTLEAV